MSETITKSSRAAILGAWLLVGIPLSWGVYNTVLNSIKLFKTPPAPSVPVTPTSH
jgi:hypothetical protein